jgi:hypothetical protein
MRIDMSPTIAVSGSSNMVSILMTDGFSTATFSFSINVQNLPPTFGSPPTDYIMNAGDVYTYKLPNFIDPEN